jgi:hypothetical protein
LSRTRLLLSGAQRPVHSGQPSDVKRRDMAIAGIGGMQTEASGLKRPSSISHSKGKSEVDVVTTLRASVFEIGFPLASYT